MKSFCSSDKKKCCYYFLKSLLKERDLRVVRLASGVVHPMSLVVEKLIHYGLCLGICQSELLLVTNYAAVISIVHDNLLSKFLFVLY